MVSSIKKANYQTASVTCKKPNEFVGVNSVLIAVMWTCVNASPDYN
jgi:hypothetical protein